MAQGLNPSSQHAPGEPDQIQRLFQAVICTVLLDQAQHRNTVGTTWQRVVSGMGSGHAEPCSHLESKVVDHGGSSSAQSAPIDKMRSALGGSQLRAHCHRNAGAPLTLGMQRTTKQATLMTENLISMHEETHNLAAACCSSSLRLAQWLRVLCEPATAEHTTECRHSHEPQTQQQHLSEGRTAVTSPVDQVDLDCMGSSADAPTTCHLPAQPPSSPQNSPDPLSKGSGEDASAKNWATKRSRFAKRMVHRALQQQVAMMAGPSTTMRASASLLSRAHPHSANYRSFSPAVRLQQSLHGTQMEQGAARRHSVHPILPKPQPSGRSSVPGSRAPGMQPDSQQAEGLGDRTDEIFGRLAGVESMLRSRAAAPNMLTLLCLEQQGEGQGK